MDRTLHRLWLICLALLVACSPAPALTPLPYADDFSDPASGWKTVDGQGLRIRYQDGALRFTIDELDQIAWSIAGRRFENFTLDVDATQLGGPSDNSYGVLIRYVDEKNFYRLDISGDGYFAINKYQAGKWIKLQDWTESAAIQREAATNHLQVIAAGPRFTLAVNGETVATFSDDEFKQGDIGLTAGTLFDEAGVQIAFGHLTVSP
jgi:hypothetical protein